MQSLIDIKDRFEIAGRATRTMTGTGLSPECGVASSQSLPFGGYLLPIPTPTKMAQGSRGW